MIMLCIDEKNYCLSKKPRSNTCKRRRNFWFTFFKLDAVTKMGLANAVFELIQVKRCKISRAVSDNRGLVCFQIKPCCDYILTEISPPPGYLPNNTQYHVRADKRGCIFIDCVFTPQFTILNQPIIIPGSFAATKIDITNGTPLAGAEFTLFRGNEQIAVSVSDANGTVSFTNLQPGNYRLVETAAPPGFQINPDNLSVVVAANGSVTINGLPANGFRLANTPIPSVFFTVTYNANGGSGLFQDIVAQGDLYTIKSPTQTGISRPPFIFIAWNTQPDGTGTTFLPGNAVIIDGDLLLYAQWEDIGELPIDPD